ncbi:DNA primase [Acetobacter sp.]|uniref:DNA primase n=1 Tax=Acetobacter sp. TaxID=440 RepID=UPI0039EC1572
MSLDAAFLDELRARTPLAPLIARRVKLTRSGRNWKGCCPFHGEKTPSFYVYDDHFHCFGCGAHGDAISFVMQIEGKGFPEAVETLAAEAGLNVPKPSPKAREEAARQKTLGDVLEAAQRIYTHDLHQPAGRPGLDYLRRRGLTDETIAAFGLGWASDRRNALVDALKPQGITPEAMAEAGLMRLDEQGRPKGELFWNRVTFPIRDRRGDLVSFGGRILGDGQPKYLNGPETALYSKRRLLFGFDRARPALRAARPRGAPPVEALVVEGYMDVIALHQAGFHGAVAPLGTAMTPEQLEILWQATPSPILCFDGDPAGRRAAIRAAETALPLISAERGLRICLLPEGEDPDSLLQQRGREAVATLFAQARPLAEMLFDLLSEGTPAQPTPEQRAGLRSRLTQAAAKIEDKTLAAEYRSTLLDQFFKTYRGNRTPFTGGKGKGRGPAPPTTNVSLDGREDTVFNGDRGSLVKLTDLALRHPWLTERIGEAWCRLTLPEDLAELRTAIMDFTDDDLDHDGRFNPEEMHARLMRVLATQNLAERAEIILRSACAPLTQRSEDAGNPEEPPEMQWWHFYARLNRAEFEADVARDNALWIQNGMDPNEWDRLKSRIDALTALRRMEDGFG